MTDRPDTLDALRARGESVAVVGDGVKDLPAMQQANLAITRHSSSPAALSVADIVLLEDSSQALLRVLDKGQRIANGLLDIIAFPMMILSGVWFSMEGTNIWAQRLAELMPLTHLVDAARRIMLDGASLSDVSTEIAILLGIALVLLGLSARAFRWQ